MRSLDSLRLATNESADSYLISEDQLGDFDDHKIEEVHRGNLTPQILVDYLESQLIEDDVYCSEMGMYCRLLTALLATVGEHQALNVLIEIFEAGGLIEVEM